MSWLCCLSRPPQPEPTPIHTTTEPNEPSPIDTYSYSYSSPDLPAYTPRPRSIHEKTLEAHMRDPPVSNTTTTSTNYYDEKNQYTNTMEADLWEYFHSYEGDAASAVFAAGEFAGVVNEVEVWVEFESWREGICTGEGGVAVSLSTYGSISVGNADSINGADADDADCPAQTRVSKGHVGEESSCETES
ncbi:hypothetical protein EYZ11_004065 [Aspergillus tanneri]|uniref:Uncharacterized protein n=1 Tax=Aspergillus tanneri TaxID=1220188 RepID=A0A4V3UPU7_9EURO|nr:uncharacterized protein ATNIH1004_006137 [Aspergillus tanneri]KAA8647444.1 hypothetical protein ATNIH1004_006137 [Aspergillus tanneri]THC96474.1 hypothetical protein EYZ11_004065 [Aspergillus tanneri]